MDSDNPIELGPTAPGTVALDAAAFCRAVCPRLVDALSLCCRSRDDAIELAQETLSRVKALTHQAIDALRVAGLADLEGADVDLAFDAAKRPRIEVTPSTGLADGQEIQVRGINAGAGSVSFSECLQDEWATCQYADATAGADGNFTATFAAQRVLHWMYHGEIDESGECGVDGDCVIEVWVTPNGFENFDSTRYRVWIEPTQPVALTFAPAPPTTTTSTTAP